MACCLLQVVLYLYALKVVHPTRVWLLRGNHESRSMSACVVSYARDLSRWISMYGLGL
jgi:hypothetical protein